MGKKTSITYDSASQTQAASESGSAVSGALNLTGSTVGQGAAINLTQITTDAGIIAAASKAGTDLIRAQAEAQRQATDLGLRSLESTKAISENLLSRAAEKSAGEPTEESKNANLKKILIIAAAALAALYIFTKKS